MTATLAASEIGTTSAGAIRDLVRRALASAPVADYAHRTPLPWSTIAGGGWDHLGVPEAAGGAGASLRDLVEVARVCGHFALPSPLIESIWTKRWSSAARELEGPVTVSVARPQQSGPAAGLALYGAEPGVLVAHSVRGEKDTFEALDGPVVDELAPVLRAAQTAWTSDVDAGVLGELGVLWAAQAVGSAQWLVERSVDFARERAQFGKPIGSFQAVKHRLADMHSSAEYADTAVLWAAREPDNAGRASRYALDTAITVAQSAIQVHGGMGFTWEMGLHYHLRSMLAWRELVNGLWP